MPRRLEHNPSFDNFPGENGEVRYGEGLFMGYRGYDHRRIEPRFPFGHGLSYAKIELGPVSLSSDQFIPGSELVVSVAVVNVGTRRGSEVVQCYIAPGSSRLTRPPQELKAFAKVRLNPGEEKIVKVVLDDRSFAYWDPGQPDWSEVGERSGSGIAVTGGSRQRRKAGWQIDPGRYEVRIGRSSRDIVIRRDVIVHDRASDHV